MMTQPPNLQAQCPYCDTPITVHQKINPGYCGAPACLHKHAVRADARREELWEEQHEKELAMANARFLPEIRARAEEAGIPAERTFVGVVPYTSAPLMPLPEERRADYLRHLSDITHAAFEQTLPEPEAQARDTEAEQGEPHPWNNAACATCKGHCCQFEGGKSHAFQTVKHMQHLRTIRPEMSAEDMIAHFTAALPEVSNKDGCVFQGPQGCVLAREERADICNTFRCRALRRLALEIEPDTADAIALVSVGDTEAHHMNLLLKRAE